MYRFVCCSNTILKKELLIQEEVYLYADDQEVEGSDFLKKLATYGKDRTWLKIQSKKVAEQYILGTWFKNGSSRYSLKNLGDMKIEYNELLEEIVRDFFRTQSHIFFECGIFAFDAGAWENDLAKNDAS